MQNSLVLFVVCMLLHEAAVSLLDAADHQDWYGGSYVEAAELADAPAGKYNALYIYICIRFVNSSIPDKT